MEEATLSTGPAGAEAPKAETPVRPDNVPEKFWDKEKNVVNVDALLNSYTELEKKTVGKPKEEAKGEEAPKQDPKPEQKPQSQEEIKDQLAKSKIDFDALTAEYTENGSLKDESYKALEEAGIPKSVVDDYIATQSQRAEALNKEIYDSVGGKEAFDPMIEWAKTNMSAAEIKAYNDSLDLGPEQAKLAVTGLHAKYIKATGGNPDLVGGSSSQSITGYRSLAEQQRDMNDPKYRTDPAFREEVERRSLASKF